MQYTQAIKKEKKKEEKLVEKPNHRRTLTTDLVTTVAGRVSEVQVLDDVVVEEVMIRMSPTVKLEEGTGAGMHQEALSHGAVMLVGQAHAKKKLKIEEIHIVHRCFRSLFKLALSLHCIKTSPYQQNSNAISKFLSLLWVRAHMHKINIIYIYIHSSFMPAST